MFLFFYRPADHLAETNLCVWRKTGGHCDGDSGGMSFLKRKSHSKTEKHRKREREKERKREREK